jgi:Pyridoxamine 5'-phosphate oxidase
MPRLSADEFDTFLAEPGHPVRIATVDADGMPRVVPLWFVRVGDDVLFTPRAPAVLHLNLQRDERVGLSIDDRTADQLRALYAVSLATPNKVSSWRMPLPNEDPTGIWAKRYYVPGTR